MDINRAYIHEMRDRYGSTPAIGGWYLPHETTDSGQRIIDINTALAAEIFGRYAGLVDYCAF